ncbi:MAG: sigma-54 dependent transcriptional regulator [Thermodesulfobacteriota bacterium]
MAKQILIIDDEQSIRETLSGILEDEGFTPICAPSAEEGLLVLEENNIDLVLLDIWLGDNMDGLTALEKIKELYSPPVIMISGHGNIETAVKATRKGAFDFVEKPLSYDKIILAITNGLRFAELEKENVILRSKTKRVVPISGNSQVVKDLRTQIERVAPTDAWVLIRGEHGTGKELVAQSIHWHSLVADRPMIEVNCAAIPEELIESELFGHEKGSFTGAHSAKRGKFDQADGGTLFLDEIGDMSMKTQAKILRILQEQKFERVGGNKTISVNVRVLAATNKNLEEEIENGNFRADLFWRLNVVPIRTPNLSERMEDIPLLVKDLMKEFSGRGLKEKEFSRKALDRLCTHSWPGNVRELKNFIERIAIMAPSETISEEDIALFLSPTGSAAASAGNDDTMRPYKLPSFKEAKKSFEQEYLRLKLAENEGNISQTAEQVGMERSHLHKKLKSLEIIN